MTLGAIVLVAAAIGIIVVTELPGSSQGASTPAHAAGATTVQRRDLVATDTESGTLSYADPQTVFNRVSGTITSLPNIGQVIKSGQTLYKVSGSPVVLFNGTVPAYRDLTSGVSDGEDVQQLNDDLRSLGFDPDHQLALNDTWQDATTTAVEAWQASLGETQTGTITLGQVVFLPGPQRITSIDTVLGSTGGSGASSAAGSATSTSTPVSSSGTTSLVDSTVRAPRSEFVSLTTTPVASTATSPQPSSPTTTTATTPSTCDPPSVPPAPGTTTTPTVAPGCEPTTTPTTTTTNPTTTTTTPRTTTTTPTTTTPENVPTKPTSGSHTGGKSSSGHTPSEEAVLLALLKAETQELKKSISASGGSSRSSAGGSGTTGASTGGSSSFSGGGGASRSGGGGTTTAAAESTGGTSSGGGGASSSSSGSGSGAASVEAILQTTSNQLVVTVDLDATKQSEAVVGEPVTVELPNGDTVNAKITEVSPVAQSTTSSSSSSSSSSGGGSGGSSSSAPSATIPVTIEITGHHPSSGLDQAAVSVNFEQQVENNVLSVPVTALLATAGGGYAVQEAAAPHTLIAVTPGLFAAGYVQISGSQIYPGLQVTDSQG
jgi:hypothetical protein